MKIEQLFINARKRSKKVEDPQKGENVRLRRADRPSVDGAG